MTEKKNRTIHYSFKATPEEDAIIQKKMKTFGITNVIRILNCIHILETFHQFGRFSCSRDCRLPYIHIPHLTAVINPTEVVRNFFLDSAGKTGSATKKRSLAGTTKNPVAVR